jgi:hypothetical protein
MTYDAKVKAAGLLKLEQGMSSGSTLDQPLSQQVGAKCFFSEGHLHQGCPLLIATQGISYPYSECRWLQDIILAPSR